MKKILRVVLGASVLAAAAGGIYYTIGRRRQKRSETIMDRLEIFEQERRAPKPGDILLFHNARGSNNLIGWFTGSPFYHVGIYAGSGKAVEARTPGVVHDTMEDRTGNYVVLPAPEGRGKKALEWAMQQVGDGYDKWDVGVIILERIFRRLHLNYTSPNKFTCGEFVATAFAEAGVDLFPDCDLSAVVPGDFARYLPAGAIPSH